MTIDHYVYLLVFNILVITTHCSLYLWERRKSSELKSCLHDNNCFNITLKAFSNGDWQYGVSIRLSHEECSLSVDLGEIVCSKLGIDPNCFLYSSVGTRTNTCYDLIADNNVFVVPPGKLFIIPTLGVGHKIELNHIAKLDDSEKPITLTTLSVYPKIFKITNFISQEESDQLIATALDTNKLDYLRLKPQDYYAQCTHEAAFDIDSHVALDIKKRSFDVLGLFPYDETFADGLKILRYNESAAFAAHSDYLPSENRRTSGDFVNYTESNNNSTTAGNYSDNVSNSSSYGYDSSNSSENINGSNNTCSSSNNVQQDKKEFDYDSSKNGTNSDTEEGGEIVFPHLDRYEPSRDAPAEFDAIFTEIDPCWSIDVGTCSAFYQEQVQKTTPYKEVPYDEVVSVNNENNIYYQDKYFDQPNLNNSWQSNLSSTCKNSFIIRPKKLEALLIYIQNPDGSHNSLTMNGICPVLKGTKWEANLWVWNGPRFGYTNQEGGRIHEQSKSISASFESKDITNAMLYWEDTYWGTLIQGRSIKVNTFPGHRWSSRHNQKILKTWIIDANKKSQRFVVSMEDGLN